MRPPRRFPVLLLLALGAAAACRGTQVASINLDQLLGPDRAFRYAAELQTGWRYLARQFLSEDWFGEGLLREADLTPVPDPTRTALANLLDLDGGAFGVDPAWVRAEQVRQYARYAAHCPAGIVRERAFLSLVEHARRLEVPHPNGLFTAGRPEDAANAAEIRLALEGLVEVLERMVEAGGEVDGTTRADLIASCALLDRLELDIDGGWRLLKVVARFGLVQRVPRAELEPILVLSTKVQARLVALALAEGRVDPHPRVRGAAVRASVAAYGDEFLREALLGMTQPGSVGPVFGLRAPRPDEEEVLIAILESCGRRGLPLPEGLSEVEARRLRLRLLFAPVQVAHDYTVYGDRARTAAMLCLGEVSGSGLRTLREGEWSSWWRGFEERENAWLEEAAARRDGEG